MSVSSALDAKIWAVTHLQAPHAHTTDSAQSCWVRRPIKPSPIKRSNAATVYLVLFTNERLLSTGSSHEFPKSSTSIFLLDEAVENLHIVLVLSAQADACFIPLALMTCTHQAAYLSTIGCYFCPSNCRTRLGHSISWARSKLHRRRYRRAQPQLRGRKGSRSRVRLVH